MNPRRGMPPEPDDPFSNDETDLEKSAIRRGLWLDESQEVVAPRRASRALPDDQDDEPTLSSIDLAPSRRGEPADEADEEPAADLPPAGPAPHSPASTSPDQAPETPAGDDDGSRWRLRVVAATLLGLGAAFGLGAIPAEPAPLAQTIPLITAISRICPAPNGAESTLLAASLEGDIQLRTIGESGTSAEPGWLQLPGRTQPVIISPAVQESGVTGGSLLSSDRQLWWGACRAPLDDQYVQVPGGANADLLIINSESTDALVDVTLSGPDGEIVGDGLRGITIPADSQRVIDLGSFADDVDALGARIRTSLGRVSAVAQIARDDSGDFATSTVQSTGLIIAAVPADASGTVVLLTNPGTSRAVVQIEAVSEAGRYALPGFESVTLDAQRTTAVDLTDAIGGLPVSVVISGRDLIAASAVVTTNGDLGIEPAQVVDESVAANDLVAVVPGPGRLQLANPGDQESLIVIDWGEDQAEATTTASAGTVVSVPIPEGAETVRVTSTAPLSAALLLSAQGRSGFAIAQLEPAARTQASMPVEIDAGLGG